MIFKSIQTRLAARSAVAMLVILVVVSTLSVGISLWLVLTGERDRQQLQLHDLLDTVQRTAEIATFLADKELAREVVEGLVGNSIVQSAVLYAEGQALAGNQAYEADRVCGSGEEEQVIRRAIYSPFNSDEITGELLLCPNHNEIRGLMIRSASYAASMLLAQIVLIGVGVAWVVVRLVTRPITTLSNRLHALDVEAGEKLETPALNRRDEIGQLVADVNAMIPDLVAVIAKERLLRQEREVSEKRFRTIFDNTATAMFLFDQAGELHSFNPAFLRSFGLNSTAVEEAEKPILYRLLPLQSAVLQAMVQECLTSQRTASGELEVGEPPDAAWLQVILSSVGGGLFQGVANDITDGRLAQLEAERRAVTDPLTSIGNRAGFESRLTRMIAQHQHSDKRFALLMMDLDRFKEVNDNHGHQAGDRVLQVVAELLRSVARKTDYAARLGGDEFALLLPDVDDVEAVERVASELAAAVVQPIILEASLESRVSASIGVGFYTAGESGAALFRRVDAAMYAAKRQGRNSYCVAD